MNDEIKEAEKKGYEKAIEMLRSSDAFYYWTAQGDYLNNLQWAYWLYIKKEDAISNKRRTK